MTLVAFYDKTILQKLIFFIILFALFKIKYISIALFEDRTKKK